jgi:heme oxygenase (biliverdin-producing, ferredoxin)
MSSNLAVKLREGTKKSHTMAENVGFIKCFLKGTVEKNSYRKLVANLYFVYSAIEAEMDRNKTHPIVSKFYFSELNRKQSLESDLAFYYGSNWRDQVAPSAAAQTYVKRIHEIGQNEPELLAAHSYTRYLGDLSGGQILKGIAVRGMNLNEGEGTAFYAFDQIPDEKAFKAKFRQVIVEEANDAFGLNMKMFMELEGSLVKAIGQMVFNALTRRRVRGSTDELVTAE